MKRTSMTTSTSKTATVTTTKKDETETILELNPKEPVKDKRKTQDKSEVIVPKRRYLGGRIRKK